MIKYSCLYKKFVLGELTKMKKILTVLIIGMFLLTGLTSLSAVETRTTTGQNIICDFCQGNKKSMDMEQIDISGCPVMKIVPKRLNPADATPAPAVIDTPDEFSWLDYNGYNWVTPARDQDVCGSCWVFATLGVFESMIKIRENCPEFQPDLSEQYVLSCLSSAGDCEGGIGYRAALNILNTDEAGNYCNGILPESCMPYQADDSVPCSDKCSDWGEMLIPLLDCGFCFLDDHEDSVGLIKTQVMQNGPVAITMLASALFVIWGLTNHDPNGYFPDIESSEISGYHEIMLVGWKDDPSVGNGGYWICKNSWGADWGYDGFFNIEYNSLEMDLWDFTWLDYDADDYDWHPIVDTGGPYSIYVYEDIIFDASDSLDVEGDILSFEWDFGDGTRGDGESIVHSYKEQGEYVVTLTVTDGEGLTSSETTVARVQAIDNNKPNKPKIKGKTHGGFGQEYTFEVCSVDPDEDDVYYEVDWGDGTVDDYGPEVFLSGEKAFFSKKWEMTGTYAITVTAMDKYGAESESSEHMVVISKAKSLNMMHGLLDILFLRLPLLSRLLNII